MKAIAHFTLAALMTAGAARACFAAAAPPAGVRPAENSPLAVEPVFCPACGAENKPGSRFCLKDGTPLPALDPARIDTTFERASETYSAEEIGQATRFAAMSVVRILARVTDHLKYPVVEVRGSPPRREAQLVSATGETSLVGSGFAIGTPQEFVTNAHVASPFDAPARLTIESTDGHSYPARVVGVDRATDLALLKIEAGRVEPLEWGDSEKLHLGEETWAIGYPLDIGLSMTRGTISSLVRMRKGLNPIEAFLHSDAFIIHGNSGGPLVDVLGRVVGVSDMGFHDQRGQGYSIPAGMARRVIERLHEKGRYDRGFIGLHVKVLDPDSIAGHAVRRGNGSVVVSVLAGSPAAAAGLQEGDVVYGINGRLAATTYLMQEAISSVGPGSRIRLSAERAGKDMDFDLTTGLRPGLPRIDPIRDLEILLNVRFEADPKSRTVVIHLADEFSIGHRQGLAEGDRIDSVLSAADWPDDPITMEFYTRRAKPAPVHNLDDLRAALARAYLGGRIGVAFLLKGERTRLAALALDENFPIVF